MDEIKLPVDSCAVCQIQNIKSVYIAGRGGCRMYYCPNCGPYSITYNAYRFTPVINDEDVKAKVSFYISHNTNEDHPILIDTSKVDEIIKSTKLPSVIEQLNSLLNWLNEKSKN